MHARRIVVSVLGATVALIALLQWNRTATTQLAPAVSEAAQDARAGKLASAVAALETHISDKPNDGHAYLLLARVRSAQQRPQNACDAYQLALAQLASQFEDLSEMALSCRQAGLVADRDPMKKRLAEHTAEFPDKKDAARMARLQMLAFDIPNTPPNLRGQLLGKVGQELQSATAPHDSRSYAIHVEALWLLDRTDEAKKLMEKSVQNGPTNWDNLTLEMALAFLQLRQGDKQAAKISLDNWTRKEAQWTGAHFGMIKPLREMVSLTQQVRWDTPSSGRPQHDENRYQSALENGIREEITDRPLRSGLNAVAKAIDKDAPQKAITAAQHTREILKDDRGCNMENALIRPHMVALLWEVEGRMHRKQGRDQAAEEAFAHAQALFPADPELAALSRPVEPISEP